MKRIVIMTVILFVLSLGGLAMMTLLLCRATGQGGIYLRGPAGRSGGGGGTASDGKRPAEQPRGLDHGA